MAVRTSQNLRCCHAWTERLKELNKRGVIELLLEDSECLGISVFTLS